MEGQGSEGGGEGVGASLFCCFGWLVNGLNVGFSSIHPALATLMADTGQDHFCLGDHINILSEYRRNTLDIPKVFKGYLGLVYTHIIP